MGSRPSAYKLRLVTRNRVLWAGKVLRGRNAAGFARRYLFEDVERIVLAAREGRNKDAAAMAIAWLEVVVRAPSIYARAAAAAPVARRAGREPVPGCGDGPAVARRIAAAHRRPAIRGHYLHLESSLSA